MELFSNYIYVCLTEECRQLGIVCVHVDRYIKKSLKLADAVKVEDMQIYKPVIRCHLLVHGEKKKINSPI